MTPTELQQFLRDKLRKAYNLGQTYWQQADSEYRRENKKADETATKFAELVENVVLAVTFELNRAARTEAAKATGTAGEIDADAEMAKVKRDVELMGVGFLVDGKRCSLDRITWFNRPGDTWLPPPPGYPVQEALQPMTMSYVQNVPDQCDRITWRGAYYHLKEGAEAARQPSPVDQPIGPISDWTLPRLYDLACRQRHEIRESDKCIKRYADELVAARQPAPVSIKTWQERAEGKVLPEIRRFITDAVWAEQNYMEMLAEIADLRAALATRSQP